MKKCLNCNSLLSKKQIALKRKYCSFKCYKLNQKNILLSKFGVDNPSKIKNVNNLRKKYFKEKFGVDNPSKNKIIINKIRRHHLEKYYNEKLIPYLKQVNLKPLFDKDNYFGTKKDKIKGTVYYYYFNCLICHNNFKTYLSDGHKPICPFCNKINNTSKGERELIDFVYKNYNGKIETKNQKLLTGKLELDIFLPDLNLAIEYNGQYWHKLREKQFPGYHKLKAKLCKEKNIKLINISDKNWTHFKEKTKIKILTKIKNNENLNRGA